MPIIVEVQTIRLFDSDDLDKKVQSAVFRAIERNKPDQPNFTLRTPIKALFSRVTRVTNLLNRIADILHGDYQIYLNVDLIDANLVLTKGSVSSLKADVKAAVRAS